MATPLAHACAGLLAAALVHRVSPLPAPWPRLALLAAFCACMPDLDIALSLWLTGSLTALHSGPTHTLAFALLAACVALLLARRSAHRRAIAAMVGLATASHVLVDYLTGPQVGLHRSYGVPALWPFVEERLKSPLTVFRGVKHGSIAGWFSPHNLTTAASELVLGIPMAWFAIKTFFRRG